MPWVFPPSASPPPPSGGGTSALTSPIYNNVIRYYGDPDTPHGIRRRRQQAMEVLRRLGTPVLIKRTFTPADLDSGVAMESPNRDTTYRQSRHNDPLSYGVGYISVQTQPGEWISPTGQLVIQPISPGTGYLPAPTYRGYGPGYLTYAALPDVPEDVFKLTPEGTFIQVQQALLQLPWYPHVGDNDLLIVCQLDAQENIINTFERYQLKQVTPVTMRGRDRAGRREFTGPGLGLVAGGNRHLVGHQCQANKVPDNDPIYQVEVDR